MKAYRRKAEGGFFRSLHITGTIRRGIAQKGGWHQLMARAYALYRREGFIGIRRGFSHMRHLVRSRAALARIDYAAWVERYDSLSEQDRVVLAKASEALPYRPRISVLMPVYNPAVEWLKEAIESVRRQIYSEWELCISDDASSDPEVIGLLKHYESTDPRIKVVLRQANGHISAASNDGLKLVSGEWVALLDHDDLLADHALFWLAEAINRHPDAGIVYSDEDKITEHGLRRDPYFKCDWNPELFRSQNMISHLGAYRSALVRDVGGFREGFEGSQDYDLALRCVEQLAPSQIIHVPRVLYHWRIHVASTARAGETKPYALRAGERALNEHLRRCGIDGQVFAEPGGLYRTRYILPAEQPLVSIIIPVHNAVKSARRCLTSVVRRTSYANFEVLLLVNDAGDEASRSVAAIDAHGRTRLLQLSGRPGYAAACNFAASHANGEILVFLNNNIEVISEDWLEEMTPHALRNEGGAVGARLLRPDGTVFHAGMILGMSGRAGYSHSGFPHDHAGYFGRAVATQAVSAVTAECLMIRKSTFLAVDGLNETSPDIRTLSADFCVRVLGAGHRNIYASYAELRRHGGAGHFFDGFVQKSGEAAENSHGNHDTDPAYSPNLTLQHEDFSYAWPPRVAKLPWTAPPSPDIG